jgi:hypothetical protein
LSNDPESGPAAPAPRRARYQPRPQSRWQRIPVSLRILVPALLCAAGWWGYAAYVGARTPVSFEPFAGGPSPQLRLQLCPAQLSFAAPSPPPPIGSAEAVVGGTVVLEPELVPGEALLRYEGDGIGTGYATLVRGRPARIQLAPPTALEGRVGTMQGFLALGLRTLGMQPIEGARVFGLGGGEHGVVLCEATTDRDGRFRLDGFSSALPLLGVRVLKEGFAMSFSNVLVGGEPTLVALQPTAPLRGKVALPAGLDAASVRVLAKGLPGIQSTVGADGTFALDHVAERLQPRLLVYGLPPEFTHPLVHAKAGAEDVVIPVLRSALVRGRVIDRQLQQPVAGALVWHDCGPAGGVTVQTDDSGRFTLPRAAAGQVQLRAQRTFKNPEGERETWTGDRTVTVDAGAELDDVILRID